MRFATWVVLGSVLLGGGSAEAGWFGSSSKHPKPLQILEVNRSWDTSHAVVHLRTGKYDKTGWGAQWKQIFRNNSHVNHHYVRSN